jgi:hypothetical protein
MIEHVAYLVFVVMAIVSLVAFGSAQFGHWKPRAKCPYLCGSRGWTELRRDDVAVHVQCVRCGWVAHVNREDKSYFL